MLTSIRNVQVCSSLLCSAVYVPRKPLDLATVTHSGTVVACQVGPDRDRPGLRPVPQAVTPVCTAHYRFCSAQAWYLLVTLVLPSWYSQAWYFLVTVPPSVSVYRRGALYQSSTHRFRHRDVRAA